MVFVLSAGLSPLLLTGRMLPKRGPGDDRADPPTGPPYEGGAGPTAARRPTVGRSVRPRDAGRLVVVGAADIRVRIVREQLVDTGDVRAIRVIERHETGRRVIRIRRDAVVQVR